MLDSTPISTDELQTQVLAHALQSEVTWLRRLRQVRLAGTVLICTILLSIGGAVLTLLWYGGAKNAPPWIGIGPLAIVVTSLLFFIPGFRHSRARERLRRETRHDLARVPLLNIRSTDRVGALEFTTDDNHLLSGSRIGGMPRALGLKVAALLGLTSFILVPVLVLMFARTPSRGTFNPELQIIGLSIFCALAAAAFSTTTTRWRVRIGHVDGAAELVVTSFSMLRGVRHRNIPMDESWFEVNHRGLHLVHHANRSYTLMPLPEGPLGTWHAVRVAGAIQRCISEHSELELHVRIQGVELPVTIWPVVDALAPASAPGSDAKVDAE